MNKKTLDPKLATLYYEIRTTNRITITECLDVVKMLNLNTRVKRDSKADMIDVEFQASGQLFQKKTNDSL